MMPRGPPSDGGGTSAGAPATVAGAPPTASGAREGWVWEAAAAAMKRVTSCVQWRHHRSSTFRSLREHTKHIRGGHREFRVDVRQSHVEHERDVRREHFEEAEGGALRLLPRNLRVRLSPASSRTSVCSGAATQSLGRTREAVRALARGLPGSRGGSSAGTGEERKEEEESHEILRVHKVEVSEANRFRCLLRHPC